ncbi:MAG: hypothetical protein ABIJ00_12785 [Candidatus Eisenbacteria bacterium]
MRTFKLTLAVLGILVFWLGCGGKYDKPLEVYKEPPSGAYTYVASLPGFWWANSMSMAGGHIFVAFDTTRTVHRYYSSGSQVGDVEFNGLDRPVAVGTSLRSVAIADSSDTITVKVYEPGGGDPFLVIRDPDWKRISALAVDDDENIYVADMGRHFVRSYDTTGKRRFAVDLADSGFGIGHVVSPRGLYFDGEALLIAEADPEKKQIQRISVDTPQQGLPFSAEVFFISHFTDEDDNDIELVKPVAVASDNYGRVIVLDQALGKIFRYSAAGHSDAIVNAPKTDKEGPDVLQGALSLGTYTHSQSQHENVFCLEAETGQIHRWEEAQVAEE